MSEEVTFSQIDKLARWLFLLRNPGAVFAAEDEATRLFWRKEAVRQLQQAKMANLVAEIPQAAIS